MNRRRFWSMVAVIVTVIVISCGGGGGGSSNDVTTAPSLEPGEALIHYVEEDEQLISSTVYRVHQIEGAVGSKPAVNVLLWESTTQHAQKPSRSALATPEGGTPPRATPPATKTDIINWLQNTWDEHHGGAADEGYNAHEFFQKIQGWGIDFDTFKLWWDTWTEGLGALESFLHDLHAVAFPHTFPAWELWRFLHRFDLTLQIYKDALDAAATDNAAFLASMNYNLHKFEHQYYLVSWLSSSSVASLNTVIQNAKAADGSGPSLAALHGTIEAGVEVLKLAWTIIEDTKPKTSVDGAFTRVLNPSDDNWANYGNARSDRTGVTRHYGKDLYGLTLYEVKIRGEVTYDAIHTSIAGRYIPHASVEVDAVYAAWPWSVNAIVHVSNARNFGSASSPNPGMTMRVNLNYSWGFGGVTETKNYYAYADLGVYQTSQR